MRCVAPIYWWTIQCYHYVTEHYRDANQNLRTRQRRVNTHFARGYFQYHFFMDKSLLLPNLREYFMTRMNFELNGNSGDLYTQNEYTRQMEYFRCVNIRDTHHDFHQGISLPGLKPLMLCEAEPGARPVLMSANWYYIFSLLGVSLFFRMWMDSKTGKCIFYFQKEVFCRPPIIQVVPTVVNVVSQPSIVNVNVVVPTSPTRPQTQTQSQTQYTQIKSTEKDSLLQNSTFGASAPFGDDANYM